MCLKSTRQKEINCISFGHLDHKSGKKYHQIILLKELWILSGLIYFKSHICYLFLNFLMEMEINYSIFSNLGIIKRMDVIKNPICYHLDIGDIMRLVIPVLSYLSLSECSWVYLSRKWGSLWTFTICPTLEIIPTQDGYCPISNTGWKINGFVLLVQLSVKKLLNTGMYWFYCWILCCKIIEFGGVVFCHKIID